MSILYEYLCNQCAYNFHVSESIKAQPQTVCPECNQPELHRVIHAASIFVRQEATTIAQQADRNIANMGKYELEAKRHEHAKAGEKARQLTGRKKRPKAKRPFWRKTDKIDTTLAKLAPDVTIKDKKIVKSEPLSEKAMNYIMTGNK